MTSLTSSAADQAVAQGRLQAIGDIAAEVRNLVGYHQPGIPRTLN